MKGLKKEQFAALFVAVLTLSVGSLSAQDTTSVPNTSPADQSYSGQNNPMGQGARTVSPSKDAYGSGSMDSKDMKQMQKQTAQPSPTAKKPAVQVEKKQDPSSRGGMSAQDKTEAESIMKPIRVNPNPPGTPVETSDDMMTEEESQKTVDDPMVNHKDSKFMLDSDKKAKPMGSSKTQTTKEESKKEKSWWEW